MLKELQKPIDKLQRVQALDSKSNICTAEKFQKQQEMRAPAIRGPWGLGPGHALSLCESALPPCGPTTPADTSTPIPFQAALPRVSNPHHLRVSFLNSELLGEVRLTEGPEQC